MRKSSIMAAFAACAFAFVTTQAQAACTQADMTKMESDVGKMTDTTKKAGAMKEVTMAKDMMAKNDTTACTMHMNNAAKMMPAM
jgi:hypothetical protein